MQHNHYDVDKFEKELRAASALLRDKCKSPEELCANRGVGVTVAFMRFVYAELNSGTPHDVIFSAYAVLLGENIWNIATKMDASPHPVGGLNQMLQMVSHQVAGILQDVVDGNTENTATVITNPDVSGNA